MGKGSRARPYSVDRKKFESNWELAFGKKEAPATTPADELAEYQKQAQEIWSDSCTTPRKPQ